MKKAAETYEPTQQPLVPEETPSVALETVRQQAVQPVSVLEIFAGLLSSNSTIEVSKIKELMELQKWAEERDAEKQFIAAMNRLQPKLPRIVKRGKIDLGKGKPLSFAKYEDVDEVIRPLMNSEGFSATFGLGRAEKGISVSCTLSHSANHSRTETVELPPDAGPGRNGLQALGSTISYAKRYLLCSMLNIVTVDEDNDGNGIGFIDERQVNNIIDMFSACEMNPESQSKFLLLMKAETVGEIHRRDYEKAMTQLNAKLRKVRGEQQ